MVTDQVGMPVPIRPVHRVVTLAPDVTELVFAVGAGALLPSAPRSADFPPEAQRLPRFDEGSIESIVAQRPDLVVATTAGTDPRTVDRLRELGLIVATTDVTSFERLLGACRLLGKLTDHPREGDDLAAGLAERVRLATERAARWPARRGLFVVWWDPLIVAAPGTFHHDLLLRAGVQNLAPTGAGRYPPASRELLVDSRLDLVVAPDEPSLRTMYAAVEGRAEGVRIARGAARVIWLPADPASRPGPRLVEALESLVRAREASP